MARDGSGTYTNPFPNFVAGTVISSDQVDSNNSDIATALTQSIAVDGQSTVTGNIPFSGFNLTGVGSVVTDADGDGVNFAVNTSANAGFTSKLFNFYEEGIYNPTLTCATSGSYGLDTTNDTLSYTKIGRACFLYGQISVTSESSPSGQLRLSLPTTSANLTEGASDSRIPFMLANHGDVGIESPFLSIIANSTFASLVNITDAGVVEAIDETRVDTTFQILVSGMYVSA